MGQGNVFRWRRRAQGGRSVSWPPPVPPPSPAPGPRPAFPRGKESHHLLPAQGTVATGEGWISEQHLAGKNLSWRLCKAGTHHSCSVNTIHASVFLLQLVFGLADEHSCKRSELSLLSLCFAHVNIATAHSHSVIPSALATSLIMCSLKIKLILSVLCKRGLVGIDSHSPFRKNSSIGFHRTRGKHNL